MNEGTARVLLTGATGFIGSHVLEALAREGFEVVALIRHGVDERHVREFAAEVRYGDICELPSLCAATASCAQVVHTAGFAKDWGRKHDFYETNVRGTLNVLEACRRNGIRQVIVTGSISSYGEEDGKKAKDERCVGDSHYPYFLDSLFPCALNYYRDSKRASTEEAVGYAREHSLNLTVLEPAWTFGEREFGTGFYSYLRAVRDGARWMPGSKDNWFHVVYAGDLARAYVLACRLKLRGTERFIIGYPQPERMAFVFGLFCEKASLRLPRLLPKWTVYPVGFAMELAWTLARSRQAPLLTRGRVNTFYDSIQYSTVKARRVLGFECQYAMEDAIGRTVNWYKEQHYL